LDWVYSIAPQLVDEKFIGHWAGLRPAIDDGKPVIGIIPNFKNIYINTGHFRKGILQAPASAKLLADHLFKKASFMDIAKFTLENRKNITEPA
jgi:glycine oxidase